MTHRTPGQLALRRRIEALISLAAPALDLRCRRWRGNQIHPAPPRWIGHRIVRTPLGGPPDGAG